MKFFALALLGLLTFTTTTDATAQSDELEKVMRRVGYDIDFRANNRYRLVLEVPNTSNRTHAIFLDPKVKTVGDYEFQEVYGMVYRSEARPAKNIYEKLLAENESSRIGYFSLIENSSGTFTIFYNAKMPADANADTLEEFVNLVMAIADEMEILATDGADEF